MKAISITGLNDYDDLEIADEYARRIDRKSVYMKKKDIGTLLFIPTKNIEQSFVYEIDEKFYSTLWTAKYDDLVKIYHNNKLIEQMSLF